MQKDQPGGCQGPRVREAARSSQNLFPRQLLAELIFKRIQCATRAALNAANTLAQPSHAPVSRPSGLGTLPRGSDAELATHPLLRSFRARPQECPEGYSRPGPFKRAEPGHRYFRPKATLHRRAEEWCRRGESSPKKMATPWPPCSRRR